MQWVQGRSFLRIAAAVFRLCLVPAILFISNMPLLNAGIASTFWKQLPDIPDQTGFAAPFAGTSGGALVLAGGANFPGAMPWEGGKKVWYDSIFVLPSPHENWKTGFKLARPLGYGVSVTTSQGILCAGGSDAHQHHAEVFILSWNGKDIGIKTLPALPKTMANGCGALVGNRIYIAGGLESPNATNAMNEFWTLDLNGSAWQELESWPGPARMFSVAGSDGKNFFLFGGVELVTDEKGGLSRRYLQDCYSYSQKKGWKRIAGMPRPAAAAASPAVRKDHLLLIVSGDDGKLVGFEPKSQHPGFPKDILVYDSKTDRWSIAGESPISRATVPTTIWHGRAIIPNGEARPGYRTPQVWEMNFK
jgi:N-acetylneuraminate epimerase